MSIIHTKASLEKGIQKVEEVTYVSRKAKKKTEQPEHVLQKQQDEDMDENIFNIKRAKNEMIKFALSNLEGQEKRNAKMQLAIKLGAKPPRRKFRNYKDLMEQKKKEKEEQETKKYLQTIGKNSIGESMAKTNLSKKNKKFKKKGVDILDVYGKVKKVVEK